MKFLALLFWDLPVNCVLHWQMSPKRVCCSDLKEKQQHGLGKKLKQFNTEPSVSEFQLAFNLVLQETLRENGLKYLQCI